MSFGQGGPPWGSGGQHQDPYHSQQGAPGPFDPRGTGPSGGTPDWAALADQSAARSRRKRWLLIGGGILATAAIAGLVATAIVSRDGRGDAASPKGTASALPGPQELPGESAEPDPAFSSVAPPTAPDPKDFVSSELKDTAPLTVDTLFPGRKLTMGGRAYAKGAVARTVQCAPATQGGLGTVLRDNGCDQVFRATYSRDGIAVTVGIAVFGRESEAKRAVSRTTRGKTIAPLMSPGVPTFCKGGPVCRYTANSYGRYAYFTATGYTTPKSVTPGDRPAFQAGDDLAEFTFRQIVRRGNAQASAAVVDPAG
ncbi:hypothetical protein GCM10010387_10590 [Streptomyces inusitatus]|uniref:Uncharacterized protein n=1 Tax=Streptomyces inusitatus TaxID=68221 RepID=A0A918UL38_9ACTN|nr:hypothetical protein [Streptomyces inusitatus]GGZ19635.1 hypothetical protein GCM10010387_10590 [Streptomyces inusitatus]